MVDALKAQGGLIAIIADEDTVTGFLLTGVGNMDARKRSNYLVVDGSAPLTPSAWQLEHLRGAETTTKAVETAFKEFCQREDVGIILISQSVANSIRQTVETYKKPTPAVLEIPSKDYPYDPSKDSILSRVQFMFGAT